MTSDLPTHDAQIERALEITKLTPDLKESIRGNVPGVDTTGLSPRQKRQVRAIKLVLAGFSDEDICDTLKVGADTLHEWLSESWVTDRLNREVAEAITASDARVKAKIITVADTALTTVSNLVSSAKSETVQLRAAEVILKLRLGLRPSEKADADAAASLIEGMRQAVMQKTEINVQVNVAGAAPADVPPLVITPGS